MVLFFMIMFLIKQTVKICNNSNKKRGKRLVFYFNLNSHGIAVIRTSASSMAYVV